MGDLSAIAVNLGAAVLAGVVVGWERSYFGRAAGLRTHVLVSLASATVMVVATHPASVARAFPPDTLRMDPGRIIQGLMTGVGFLGAGVIVKEGVSIYGLTNAASVWMSAALGIVLGLGYFGAGAMATAATLAVLVGLRWVELSVPRQVYALATFRFDHEACPTQAELKAWLGERGLRMNHFSYRKLQDGRRRELSGTVQARREADFMSLETELNGWPGLVEYDLSRNNK